jgi:hypothetical protein
MLSDGRSGESVEDASQKAKKTDERSSTSPEKRARHRPREQKSAEAAGIDPQEFTNKVSQNFRDLADFMSFLSCLCSIC